VKLSEGHGHSINCCGSGMLLLLPEEVDHRQVFEVQVPSEARATQVTKLGGSVLDPLHSGERPRLHVPGGHPFPV
jgi:hypothetical protein